MSKYKKKQEPQNTIKELAELKHEESKQEIISDKLMTSNADIKRREKNEFINTPPIQNTFQQLTANLNEDSQNNNLSYLVKGSSSWYANFFLADDRNVTIQESIGQNIGFLPQNWDIEVYCPESKISTMICKYYNQLLQFHNNLNDTNSEDYETCVSFSKNIIMNDDQKVKIENKCALTKATRRTEEKVQLKRQCSSIKLEKPIGFENFKAYQLRLCVRIKDNPNEEAWESFNDKDECESTENFHFIYYITFHQIPDILFQDFKTNFLSKITRTINNITYLNYYGHLFYATLIKANSGREFRKGKGMDLDNYRLDKLLYAITGINNENELSDQQKRQRSEIIINSYYNLYKLITLYFANEELWETHLIPNEFWFVNLKQELVKRMLQNYFTPSIPNGIVQKLDDLTIEYYRPILNTIVKELYDNINSDIPSPLVKKFPKHIFKVMIAGGDAFERYVPTNKIADIDLKIIIQHKEGKTTKKEDKMVIINYVRQVIFAILSKHIVILNKMTEECDNDNSMFINAVKQEQEQFYDSTCQTLSNKVFKLCPKVDSATNFRLRNLPVVKANVFNFNLVSIDMRKSFNVYYNDDKTPMNYKYDLAILDVPFKFYTDFEGKDIDLQPIVESIVNVNENCFINSFEKEYKVEQPLKPSTPLKPSELSLTTVRGREAVPVPPVVQRRQYPNLCDNPNISVDITPDGLCLFRSILYCMSQLDREIKIILMSQLNQHLLPQLHINLNEMTYNINDQDAPQTIIACSKIAYAVYHYLQSFYIINKRGFYDMFENILEAQDYRHPYFTDLSRVFQNNLQRYRGGIETGNVFFNNDYVDEMNNPLEWPGALEVTALQTILNVVIQTMLYRPEEQDKLILYVCYNGRNHYSGVNVFNLPQGYSKRGYRVDEMIIPQLPQPQLPFQVIQPEITLKRKRQQDILRKIKEEERPVKVRKISPDFKKSPNHSKKTRVIRLFNPITETWQEKKVFRFDGDDDITLPIASVAFLIKDQEHMYSDVAQLEARYFAGKINKDITRYINLNKFINDKLQVSQEQINKLNKFDHRYYNFSVIKQSEFSLKIKKEIFGYYLESLAQFEVTKLKSSVERQFNFGFKYSNYPFFIVSLNRVLNPKNIKEFSIYNLVNLINKKENKDLIVSIAEIIKEEKKKQNKNFRFLFQETSKDFIDNFDNDFEPIIINIDDIEEIY